MNWVWLRPKKLEGCLRKQGLTGNPYRLLFGDSKEFSKMIKEVKSKPISTSDNIPSRVQPFLFHSFNKYGKHFFFWIGPVPRVTIMDPELIREVLIKLDEFPKPISNPLVKFLSTGLVNYEGEQWAKHRKLLNPAFHQEKLKVFLTILTAFSSQSIFLILWAVPL